jgi:hypothetical protein
VASVSHLCCVYAGGVFGECVCHEVVAVGHQGGFLLVDLWVCRHLGYGAGVCASPDYQSGEFVYRDFINETGWPDGIAWLLGLLPGGLGLTAFDAVAVSHQHLLSIGFGCCGLTNRVAHDRRDPSPNSQRPKDHDRLCSNRHPNRLRLPLRSPFCPQKTSTLSSLHRLVLSYRFSSTQLPTNPARSASLCEYRHHHLFNHLATNLCQVPTNSPPLRHNLHNDNLEPYDLRLCP